MATTLKFMLAGNPEVVVELSFKKGYVHLGLTKSHCNLRIFLASSFGERWARHTWPQSASLSKTARKTRSWPVNRVYRT